MKGVVGQLKKHTTLIILMLILSIFAGCSSSKTNYDPFQAEISIETESTDLEYIAESLMNKYLSEFKNSKVEKKLRLKDYKVISVDYIEGKEDYFTCSVLYSVKPSDYNSYWEAGNGEPSFAWVKKCSAFIKVEKSGSKYVEILIGTGL